MMNGRLDNIVAALIAVRPAGYYVKRLCATKAIEAVGEETGCFSSLPSGMFLEIV